MTNRRYEYIKGLNGHSEIALYVDTFEEVDEAYKKAVENGATSVLEPNLNLGDREPAILLIRKEI